ncbi:hypothetical protein AB8O64_11290 [Streptomyces sp. QH1-20]|uniref:hypothetical protein n=1 Tax=Streptomyces sp. QH1-20 TaxID=3240934 RepID=UPI003511E94E
MNGMARRFALVAGVVVGMLAGAGSLQAAVADGPGEGTPTLVVSPAPGKLTKERKETLTYTYDPKGSGESSDQASPGGVPQPPAPPEPGPVTAAKDTANSASQSLTSGLSSTLDASLK